MHGQSNGGWGRGDAARMSLRSFERVRSAAPHVRWHSLPRQRQLGLNDVKRCCTSERVMRLVRSVAEDDRREQTLLS
jgi:hypothetical protein